MPSKWIVQKNAFAVSLAIVGRAVNAHPPLPVLSNVLLQKDEGQLRLSATDLTLGVTVWMDASMDGDFGLTLPARTLTDVVNNLTEPEIAFSANGKPEAALKCGSYKGTVKGMEASEFPVIPAIDVSGGISLEAAALKRMIQRVAFAASADDSRPVLTGVLVKLAGKTVSMVAADGFRLAISRADLPADLDEKELVIPASTLKEVTRILGTTKASRVMLFLPKTSSQVVFRCENVQIVSQLIEGKFPDYRAILPKGYKTRTVIAAPELLKACQQASVIAREGSNVVRLHLIPGPDGTGKLLVQAQSDETGASEIELLGTVEGQELEIAFNVKFLLDALEAISTRNVVLETNAHNQPAIIRPAGEEVYQYLLMPMHLSSS